MKSFFDVLKTMFYRKNAKRYGTPDRSRKEPVPQQKVQIKNTEAIKAAPSLKENGQHNKSERTNSKVDKGMDKEDFLLKQIDEFREKAKQLQALLVTKEDKVQELQNIVDEREEKAKELQHVLNARKSEADVLLTGVHGQMEEMINRVEEKLNALSEKIAEDVNDSTGRTAEQTAQMQASLQEISQQLDSMKLELAEKIHTEDVKCYRNMQDLIKELTVKLEENDTLEKSFNTVKGYAKCLTWFSIINFVVLVAFILYSLGLFNF